MSKATTERGSPQTRPIDLASHEIVRVVTQGLEPNGTEPEACGQYAEPVRMIKEAYTTGGTKLARQVWDDYVAPGWGDLAAIVAGEQTAADPLAGLRSFTADELLSLDLPEPDWIVESVIPEGLSLLVAPPKIGKTFLALNVAVAVAGHGVALGKAPASGGRVLYINLDGSLRGMQKRLGAMLRGESIPKNLHVVQEWERADEGGLRRLDAFLRAYSDTKLVVIDVLQKFRPKGTNKRGVYEQDYEALGPLRQMCEEHAVSIIVVHHTNKRTDGDELNAVSGSTGLAGAVENVLLLTKERGQVDAKLTVIPREEEEISLALSFDGHLQTWILRGNFDEFAKTKERQRILDLIRQHGRPMTAKEICDLLDGGSNVRRLLRKMVDAGTLAQPKQRGPYCLSTLPQTGNIGNKGNNEDSGNDGNNPVQQGLAYGDGAITDSSDVTVVTDVTGVTDQ